MHEIKLSMRSKFINFIRNASLYNVPEVVKLILLQVSNLRQAALTFTNFISIFFSFPNSWWNIMNVSIWCIDLFICSKFINFIKSASLYQIYPLPCAMKLMQLQVSEISGTNFPKFNFDFTSITEIIGKNYLKTTYSMKINIWGVDISIRIWTL